MKMNVYHRLDHSHSANSSSENLTCSIRTVKSHVKMYANAVTPDVLYFAIFYKFFVQLDNFSALANFCILL